MLHYTNSKHINRRYVESCNFKYCKMTCRNGKVFSKMENANKTGKTAKKEVKPEKDGQPYLPIRSASLMGPSIKTTNMDSTLKITIREKRNAPKVYESTFSTPLEGGV